MTLRGPNPQLSKLLANFNQKSSRSDTLISVYGELREKVDALFDSCKKYLHGEYQLYTVYKDLKKNPAVTYGLVYIEFYEKDFSCEEEFLSTYKKDAILLHTKLLQSKLELDYYYLMPYYNTLDGKSVLYNSDIILTNELEIEEV